MAKLVRFVCEGNIPNFRSECNRSAGDAMKSIFSIPDTNIKGYLKVYPGGVNDQYKDYVSVTLELTNNEEENNCDLMGKFDLWIPKVEDSKKKSGVVDFSLKKCFGYPDYMKRDKILDSANGVLVKNKHLRFHCEINVSMSIVNLDKKENNENVKKVVFKDLRQLSKELTSTDVTLKIENQRFEAHKIVLMVRSKKFKEMFTEKSDEIEFEIDDVPAELMPDFLRYIYTSKVNVAGLKLIDFWKVICCYELQNLKLQQKCEKELLAEINNENIVELLKFGIDLGYKEFYDDCLVYIDDNWRQISRQPSLKAIFKQLKN